MVNIDLALAEYQFRDMKDFFFGTSDNLKNCPENQSQKGTMCFIFDSTMSNHVPIVPPLTALGLAAATCDTSVTILYQLDFDCQCYPTSS